MPWKTRQELYPHLNFTLLGKMLHSDTEDGIRHTREPPPIAATSLPHYAWIQNYVKTQVVPNLPYNLSEARHQYLTLDADRFRQQGRSGKKNKGVVETIVSNSDSDSEEQDIPRARQPLAVITGHAKPGKQPRRKPAAPPKSNPPRRSQLRQRGKNVRSNHSSSESDEERPTVGNNVGSNQTYRFPAEDDDAISISSSNEEIDNQSQGTRSESPQFNWETEHAAHMYVKNLDRGTVAQPEDEETEEENDDENSDRNSDRDSNKDSDNDSDKDSYNMFDQDFGDKSNGGPGDDSDKDSDTLSYETDTSTREDKPSTWQWEIDNDHQLPAYTVSLLYNQLNIAQLNIQYWTEAKALTTPSQKSVHTKQCKAKRLQLIRDFIWPYCQGWDPNQHDDIPSIVLQYMSEKDYFRDVWEDADGFAERFGYTPTPLPDHGRKRGGAKRSQSDGTELPIPKRPRPRSTKK